MMFSDLYPVFHKRYPGITFRIHEARIKRWNSFFYRKKSLWPAWPTPPASRTRIWNTGILARSIWSLRFLPVTRWPIWPGKKAGKHCRIWTYPCCVRDYFVLPTRDTLSRELADRTFLYNNIRPKILFETGNNRTMLNMAKTSNVRYSCRSLTRSRIRHCLLLRFAP